MTQKQTLLLKLAQFAEKGVSQEINKLTLSATHKFEENYKQMSEVLPSKGEDKNPNLKVKGI